MDDPWLVAQPDVPPRTHGSPRHGARASRQVPSPRPKLADPGPSAFAAGASESTQDRTAERTAGGGRWFIGEAWTQAGAGIRRLSKSRPCQGSPGGLHSSCWTGARDTQSSSLRPSGGRHVLIRRHRCPATERSIKEYRHALDQPHEGGRSSRTGRQDRQDGGGASPEGGSQECSRESALEHSDKAMKQSQTAHEASKVAGVKSKAAAH